MTRITQQQLESYLWGAAVLLRGTIDAGDYKQFIFPLLFYKRLCDVFDEEVRTALKESDGDETFALFPENHRFQVPAEAHWREIRKVGRDVGRAIQGAMRAIETANPHKLYGIFGDAQWTNKDRLSDAMLRDLVEHFSTLELTVANLPEDELGQGYEYLIKKFADDSGHTAAEFYTNRTVVHLMTELLDVQPGESVYDPTCGSGGMLLSCIAHLRRQGKEWRNVKLFGQERNLMTSSIARMNCFLHGIEDFRIERGDTLAEPKLVQGDRLMHFDVVLANPPYSIKQWDRDTFAFDPWGRNLYGTPPQSIADYAFFQHILASLAPKTGRCAILFPHGVLFRDAEDEMRRRLIDADLIECVVGLGMNLFYNSSMPSCVVICRTAKPKARKGKILLINAVNEVTRERTQSFLTDANIKRIVEACERFKDEAYFARVVTLDEVRRNGGNLNLPLYVVTEAPISRGEGRKSADAIPDAIDSWLRSRESVVECLRAMTGAKRSTFSGKKLQANNARELFRTRGTWQRVRLGDLLEKTEETERNPLEAGLDRYLLVEHLDADCLRIRRWGNIADGNLPPTFYKVFRTGQILYPTRNPHLRRAAVASFDGICGEKTLTLTVKDGTDPRFLPWLFQSEAFITFATNRKIGSTNPHVRWRDVAEFEFDLPPLDQQQRAAEILWSLDKVQTAYKELRQVLHEYKAALIADVLARFRSKSEKLGTRIKVQGGFAFKSEDLCADGVRLLKIANVQVQRIEWTEVTCLPASFLQNSSAFSLKSGDYLMALTRPIIGDGLKVAKVGNEDVPSLLNQRVARFVFLNTNVDHRYFYGFLTGEYFRKEVEKRILTSNQPNISTSEVENIEIPFPESEIQRTIGEKFEMIEKTVSQLAESRRASLALRDALLFWLSNEGGGDV